MSIGGLEYSGGGGEGEGREDDWGTRCEVYMISSLGNYDMFSAWIHHMIVTLVMFN